MSGEIEYVLKKLAWMEAERIWPNGRRYLWTDAFGLVLLLSLYERLGEDRFLLKAHQLVLDVDRVLGRKVGYRIGEAADRDGQYFHYLAMWLYALGLFGRFDGKYRQKAIESAAAIHHKFVVPDIGIHWKMLEDLSAPYPGYGLGALDPFHGYTVYGFLEAQELQSEMAQMKRLMDRSWHSLHLDQDLGIGMMLWFTHFHPGQDWALSQKRRCLQTLDSMWIDPPRIFLPPSLAEEHKVCLHQLWCFTGTSSRGELAVEGRPA